MIVADFARDTKLGYLFKLSRDRIIPPSTILTVYKSLIRPALEYAFPVWYNGTYNTSFQKLLAFERKAIRISFGFPRWTSNEYLYNISRIEPLDVRLRRLAAKYLANANIEPDILIDGTLPHRLKTRAFPVGKLLQV